MSKLWLIMGVTLLALGGCVRDQPQLQPVETSPRVEVRQDSAASVLACVQDNKALNRVAFKEAYAAATRQVAEREDGAVLRLICLSLHEYASYKQFKGGIEAAEAYVGTLTEDSVGMKGLLALMQRLDKEKIARWMAYNRGVEEKEGLAAENKELMERNGQLEKNAVQDQGRIRDLQKQIEQLKNIENIIKNRDR